jgi:hypothetical protein
MIPWQVFEAGPFLTKKNLEQENHESKNIEEGLPAAKQQKFFQS